MKAHMGFMDPDDLPTPDVAGEGTVTCPCGGLTLTLRSTVPGGGLLGQCPACGNVLEPWLPNPEAAS